MKAAGIAGVLILMALSAYLSHRFWPGEGRVAQSSVTDTVFISHAVHDSSIGKLRYVRIRDKVNADSLWQEALAHARDEISRLYPDDTTTQGSFFLYRFESQMDTTFRDSLMQLKVCFNSPFPLHPSSYFKYDVSFKERQIERTNTFRYNNFWNRFSYSFSCGFGYGVINKKFDLYIGLGGSFNFN